MTLEILCCGTSDGNIGIFGKRLIALLRTVQQIDNCNRNLLARLRSDCRCRLFWRLLLLATIIAVVGWMVSRNGSFLLEAVADKFEGPAILCNGAYDAFSGTPPETSASISSVTFTARLKDRFGCCLGGRVRFPAVGMIDPEHDQPRVEIVGNILPRLGHWVNAAEVPFLL